MQKTKYIALILSCIVIISAAIASKSNALDEQLIETISAKVAKRQNEKISILWNDLRTRGYVARVGSDEELRYQFVTLQGIMEESICELLRDKYLLKSKMVFITPQPSTPLRKTISEIQKDKAAAQTSAEKLALETVEYRNGILIDQYLAEEQGQLIVVYNKSTHSNMGAYKKLVEKHKTNLVDKPVIDTFVPNLMGANYKLIDKYNADIFISFQSYQFLYQEENKKDKWAMWFGNPKKDSVIAARQRFVDEYLSTVGVSEFNFNK